MTFSSKFSNLGAPEKIWVVSAIHGEKDRLVKLHKTIFDKFSPKDRLVYTGNYLCGKRADPIGTLDEILYFRRTLMAKNLIEPQQLIYLRGIQEELWNKILQLPFAQSAKDVLEWMIREYPEMDALLKTYRTSLEDGLRIAREGVLSLTKWSAHLRASLRENPGHEAFFSTLHRAAFTEQAGASGQGNLLFVHAGIDPERPLLSQGDRFWWGFKQFDQMAHPYAPFKSVVRGYDPTGKGVQIGPVTISLDGTTPYGRQLICAEMSGKGDVLEVFAA